MPGPPAVGADCDAACTKVWLPVIRAIRVERETPVQVAARAETGATDASGSGATNRYVATDWRSDTQPRLERGVAPGDEIEAGDGDECHVHLLSFLSVSRHQRLRMASWPGRRRWRIGGRSEKCGAHKQRDGALLEEWRPYRSRARQRANV